MGRGHRYRLLVEDARVDGWPFAERLGALTLASVIVAGLLGWAAIADFDDALRRVVASTRRPAEGGMRMRVCDRARPDEVGAVAKAVDALQAGLAAAAKLRDESAAAQNEVVSCFADAFSRLAEGDLTCAIQDQVAAEFEPLRKSYNVAVGALRAEVSSMIDGARTVGRDAIEVSRAAERLAHCSGQQQAEWLEQMNAALDDTTAVARKVTEGSVSAQAVAKAAETEATWGEQIVRETVAAMNSVGKTSAQVGAIISVMDKVASQTNLLALNAGIEAARAGDFGRGFGVVATEVGALARRSAAAAKEIRGLIGTSMSHMSQRIALIQQSGEAFGRIRAQVAASVEMVSEIAAAAREQAAALAAVNNAVNQISQAALPALTVTGELTAEARSVADDAARLEALTDRFKLGAAA